MTTITIRKLDDSVKLRLRVRAARHGRSIEEEAREILKAALVEKNASEPNLAQALRRHVDPFGGVELVDYRSDFVITKPESSNRIEGVKKSDRSQAISRGEKPLGFFATQTIQAKQDSLLANECQPWFYIGLRAAIAQRSLRQPSLRLKFYTGWGYCRQINAGRLCVPLWEYLFAAEFRDRILSF